MGKHICEYCNGYTVDDRYGNCSACGAPRKNNSAKVVGLLGGVSLATSASCSPYYGARIGDSHHFLGAGCAEPDGSIFFQFVDNE